MLVYLSVSVCVCVWQENSKLKYNLKVPNRAIKRPFLTAHTHTHSHIHTDNPLSNPHTGV